MRYERAGRAECAPAVHDALLAEELLERSRVWIAPFLPAIPAVQPSL